MTDPAAPGTGPKKLIVCATPRSSSTTVVAGMRAAGLGHPLEYFHPNVMRDLCKKWGLAPGPDLRRIYLQRIMAECSENGVFGTKVLFGQFLRGLTNDTGAELFRNASVVWLFRTDLRGQAASFKTAQVTGLFSTIVVKKERRNLGSDVLGLVNQFADQNGNWMRFFAHAGIRPMVLTSDEVNADPVASISRIAAHAGLPVDLPRLTAAMAERGKYEDATGDKARYLADLAQRLPPLAFQRTTYHERRNIRALSSGLFRVLGRKGTRRK